MENRGTERKQWQQTAREMTDKVNIWLCVQSNEACSFTPYTFMERLLLAGHWAGPLRTVRNRRAWPLPPRAEMLRPVAHQNHLDSYFKKFSGSHPGTLKRIFWVGPGICILRFLCEIDTACLQTDIWAWQIIKQQQSPLPIMICGRYTASSENLEEGLSRNTGK